ncbi:MAG: NUDIX domain-containing protein [Bacteroidales bacterium]|jgi:8-oxo-dGTP pyrophosphatase MutT (NUDIX family)|nr:NUDIX domain-containing protein [Bacteroidales bacterium]
MIREIFHENKRLLFINTPTAVGKENDIIFSDIYQLIRLFKKHFISGDNNKDVTVFIPKKFNVNEVFLQFTSCFEVVNASGGLVHTPNGKYLYIFRRGKWDLPKGHKERKEKKETTALREVREETGVANAQIVKQLPSTHHFLVNGGEYKIKETHWFEMLLPFATPTTPQVEEEIEQARWLTRDEVIERLPFMYGSIAELTRRFLDLRS